VAVYAGAPNLPALPRHHVHDQPAGQRVTARGGRVSRMLRAVDTPHVYLGRVSLCDILPREALVSMVGSEVCPTCGAPPSEFGRARSARHSVIVSGLDLPFWNLVLFLVKLSIASIPAAFVLTALFLLLVALVNTLGPSVFGP
jgi:hypothetical protein